jgi:hypothetical protein
MDKMNELKEQEKKLNYRELYEKDKLSTITEKDDNTNQNTDKYNNYIKNKLYSSDEEEAENSNYISDNQNNNEENDNQDDKEDKNYSEDDDNNDQQLDYV